MRVDVLDDILFLVVGTLKHHDQVPSDENATPPIPSPPI